MHPKVKYSNQSVQIQKPIIVSQFLRFITVFVLINSILIPSIDSQNTDSIHNWNSHAINLIRNGENLNVLSYLEPKKEFYELHLDEHPNEVIIFYHILSQASNDLNNHEKCINYSLNGISAIESKNRLDSNYYNYSYFLEFCSTSYSKIHDYYRALNFVHKGLKHNHTYERNDFDRLSYLNTAGIIYKTLNEPSESFKFYKQSLEILQTLPPELQFNRAYTLQNLSQTYLKLNKPDSSLLFLEQSIAIQESNPEIFQRDYFSLYATAANRYLGVEQPEKAGRYFEKSTQQFHENAPVTEIAHYYKIKAKLKALDGKFDEALAEGEKARKLLVRTFDEKNIRTLFPEEYFSVLTTLQAIREKEYVNSQREDYLLQYYQSSLEYVNQAEQIIRHISSDAVKTSIIGSIKPLFRHAIHAAFKLGETNHETLSGQEIGNLFESYHSLLVNKETSRRDWIRQNEIPSGWDTDYTYYKSRYDSLLHESYRVEQTDAFDSPYVRISRAMYTAEDSLRALDHQLKQRFPSYKSLMEQSEKLTPDELNAVFDRFQSVLSFFEYEDELYIFHLTETDHKLIQVSLDDSLKKSISRWNTAISTDDNKLSKDDFIQSLKDMHQSGNYLFEQLIKPLEKELNTHILVVPDGRISEIAFPALNRNIPDNPLHYQAADYLVEHYVFSSHFSLKLASKMIVQTNQPVRESISLIPNQSPIVVPDPLAGDSLTLSPLPFSVAEGRLVQNLFEGDVIATADNTNSLLSKLKSTKLLHIGSHVVLNDRFPDHSYIPVLDSSSSVVTIKSFELSQHQLGNDLVIVNACHSGAAQSAMGRGLLSFVRGFALSDVKCILSSRWAVQDKQGFQMLSGILHHLDAGAPVSDALHNTQLEFLHSGDPYRSHPYSWAPYYLMGDVEVKITNNYRWGIWLVGILLVSILFFVWRKRKIILSG